MAEGMDNEFKIIAEARLNKDSSGIKQDLKDISDRLGKDKMSKVKVGVELDKATVSKLGKQVKDLVSKSKGLKPLDIFEGTSKSFKDLREQTGRITKDVENLNREAQALSTTSKIDLISGKEIERVNAYRQSLKTIRKEMLRFNEMGDVTSRQNTYSVNNVKAQTELYKNLKSIIGDIHKIEKEMIGKKGESLNFLKQQRAERQKIKQEYENEIKSNRLKSQEMERQIKLQQNMHNIQQKIRSQKGTEKQSNEAYRQLNSLLEKEYNLKKQIGQVEGKALEILQKRISATQQTRQNVEKNIGAEKLSNQQKYVQYVEKEKSLIAELNQLDAQRSQKDQARLDKSVQKTAYKQIKDAQNEIYQIEQKLLTTQGKTAEQLKEQKQIRQGEIETAQKMLDTQGVRNKSIDQEIQKKQELRKIEMAIKREKGTDAQSKKAYAEINRLIKKQAGLQKQAEAVEGETKKTLVAQSKILGDIIRQRQAITKSSPLHNLQREEQMLKEIKKAEQDIVLARAKRNDRESVRTQRLGGRDQGVDVSGLGDFSDMDKMRNFLQSVSGSDAKITQMRRNVDSLGNVTMSFTRTTELANGQLKEQKMALDHNTKALYKKSEAMRPNINRLLGFVEQMRIAFVRSVQWGLAMGALYGNLRKLREGIDIVKNLDKELTQVAITTGQTREETRYLGQEYSRLAIEMGKTVAEISAVNTELVRQGLSIEESQRRLQTVLKLSASAGLETRETLSIITSSVNALGEEAEKTADVLLRSGQISASSAGQIGEALTKVASSAKATDMSLEEITATISTLVEVTQESPNSLGNSMKTILARFNQINEETGEVNQEFNKVQKAFESVGIAFLDAEGQIRPVYELLTELSSKWGDLDRNTKMYISTQSAGKESLMPEHIVICA